MTPTQSAHRATAFHALSVSKIESLTDDSVAISFDVPADLREEFDFAPGQHLIVRTALAGDDVRRSYSICAPSGQGRLRIGVKRLPGGAFSEHALSDLAVGTELEVMAPTGGFSPALDSAHAKHYGLIGAGSGITPLLSIVASVLEQEPESRVTLIYANRTQGSVMFVEDLEDLKNRFAARFHLIHVLSRQPVDAELLSGRLDGDRLRRIFEALLPVPSVDDWYLCGPQDMVEDLLAVLAEAGADPAHVHRELFHVEDVAPVRPVRADGSEQTHAKATVTLDGKTSTVPIEPGDDSVLGALLRQRPDAPFACRGGVCGTCRAKVTEGSVQMRQNYALEPDEVARGYVLTCQSLPTTDEVTVDYDS